MSEQHAQLVEQASLIASQQGQILALRVQRDDILSEVRAGRELSVLAFASTPLGAAPGKRQSEA